MRAGRRDAVVGWLLLLPAVLWLAVFLVVALHALVATSLYDPQGSPLRGYEMTWAVGNLVDAVREHPGPLARSLLHGLAATAVCLVLGWVVAHALVFRAGRWRGVLLVLLVAPLLTSFLVRTLAWKLVLADDGQVAGALRTLHLLGPDDRVLATPLAVVGGLSLDVLPFMVLPIYASLERIGPHVVDAARDLGAGPWARLTSVTWPLALPGVVAGVLLTFVPAAGDLVNAELLGGPGQATAGGLVQRLATDAGDLPGAAALAVVLVVAVLGTAALLVAVLLLTGRRPAREVLG